MGAFEFLLSSFGAVYLLSRCEERQNFWRLIWTEILACAG
jgi:hypothetical protein